VKIAHNVQTAEGAVVFGQQMIDQTFGSRGVNILHDVKAGKSASAHHAPKGFPAGAANR